MNYLTSYAVSGNVGCVSGLGVILVLTATTILGLILSLHWKSEVNRLKDEKWTEN